MCSSWMYLYCAWGFGEYPRMQRREDLFGESRRNPIVEKTRAGIASESEQVHDPMKDIFGLECRGRRFYK